MKLSQKDIKKIAIFRALQLGDMLCVIPAVRALRNAYPMAEIYLLGLPWGRSFVDRFDHYFDGFLHFPGYPGLPEQPFNPQAFAAFLPQIQQMEFDLILQMQGNGSLVNPLMELFGAKYPAGFKTDGHYAAENGLFIDYPDFGSEIERHLSLMEHLGVENQGTALEFPLTATDYQDLYKLQLDIVPQKYVCVHPGSRGAWRQWPVQHFAGLADFCIQQGYQVVLTGTAGEKPIIDAVLEAMQYNAINTTGLTSLGAIGALIKDSAMLIANCTGVSHIAAAFKTPSIVISMDGEPHRWGPIDKLTHRTINWLQSPDFGSVFRETAAMFKQMA